MKRYLSAALVAACLAMSPALAGQPTNISPSVESAPRATQSLPIPKAKPVAAPMAAVAVPAAANDNTSKVTVPWGDIVSALAQTVATFLGLLGAWAIRRLPANVIAIFGNARIELLLNNAIGFGLNAVQGASKGKVLEVPTGNAVLAAAFQYALDNSSSWLVEWAGGPDGLAKKIWARLDLDPAADVSAVNAVLAKAA